MLSSRRVKTASWQAASARLNSEKAARRSTSASPVSKMPSGPSQSWADENWPARTTYPADRRSLFSPTLKSTSSAWCRSKVGYLTAVPAINPTHYEQIPTFPENEKDGGDHFVHAVIETPARQRHKYAFEPKYGAFQLKAVLAEGLSWPYDYGFIPQTLAEDGDPLDVLFLADESTFP